VGVSIEHVLFDADGVLQDIPGGWEAAVSPYVGDRWEEFLRRAWDDEFPYLSRDEDFVPVLGTVLTEYGITTTVERFHSDVWLRIEVAEQSISLVRDLKRAGYGVHLATNQAAGRAAYMRTELGDDDLFDVSCYSHELGLAKPDVAFFQEAARRIGASPGSILFVDDSPRNVAGAREAGLAAEHWDLSSPRPLTEVLADHGVRP
jgi:putative hydrolase of the HAD superfamily